MASRAPLTASLVLALSFVLTACGSGQTVEEACDLVQSEVEGSAKRFQELNTENTKNPSESFALYSKELRTISKKVSNKEVKDALTNTVESIEELTALLAEFEKADGDLAKQAKLQEQAAELEERAAQKKPSIEELCDMA